MAQEKDTNNINNFLDFLTAPEDEYVIHIDCSDCDQLASLAEKVAAGTPVAEVLPALSDHIKYWRDCREEFEALVGVLRAEDDGSLSGALDELTAELNKRLDNPGTDA